MSAAPIAAPQIPPSPAGTLPPGRLKQWHKPLFIAFLAGSAINLVLFGLRIQPTAHWRWTEAVYLLLAVSTTLLALEKRLPLQNAVMAAVTIAGISALILLIGCVSGVPFGPFVYSDRLGGRLFETLPWPVPLIWVVVLINARGVARLIMRPWRRTNFYGFWVIGFTCLLAVLFDLGLEPFAVLTRHWWAWLPTKASLYWHTAPWINFLGWFIASLATLVFATPWLINKQPVKRPMDYQPLIVWLLINLSLAVSNAANELWLAVSVCTVGNAIAVVFAVRGARWASG